MDTGIMRLRIQGFNCGFAAILVIA